MPVAGSAILSASDKFMSGADSGNQAGSSHQGKGRSKRGSQCNAQLDAVSGRRVLLEPDLQGQAGPCLSSKVNQLMTAEILSAKHTINEKRRAAEYCLLFSDGLLNE